MRITKPSNGDTVEYQCVELHGDGAPPGKQLWCTVGTRSYQFRTDQAGSFQQVIVLEKGDNRIEVHNDGEVITLSVAYREEVPKRIWIELVWDTDETDIDLHVLEPDGTMVYYGNQTSVHGGRLDVDDTDGFGPEHYTLGEMPGDRPLPGKYTVWVNFYADHRGGLLRRFRSASTDCTVRWRVDGGEMSVSQVAIDEPKPGSIAEDEMADHDLALPYARFVTVIDLPAVSAIQVGRSTSTAASGTPVTVVTSGPPSTAQVSVVSSGPLSADPTSVVRSQPTSAAPSPVVTSGPASFRLKTADHKTLTFIAGVAGTWIGRDQLAELGQESSYYSRPQVRVSREGGEWHIQPAPTTTNSTFLNGSPLTGPTSLKSGDTIAVGSVARGIRKLPLVFEPSEG